MAKFAGKTAIVTGGASGIGLGVTEAFAAAGMRVLIADLRQSALEQAMKRFANTRLAVFPVQLDVTDRDQWVRVADEIEEQFGEIHVLVNNAGVGVTGALDAMSYNDWDFCLGVNLGGVVNGLTTILPRIRAHGEGGHVVTTCSTAGLMAVSGAGAYCAAKFAVTGLMETLADELQGSGIGVSILYPGPVDTDLGASTVEVRPRNLQNETVLLDPIAPPAADTSVFMNKYEIGRRLLRGMERGDLFIMSHPEFRDGIQARSEALLRAVPDEPANEARIELIRQYGTLLYNPIYEAQSEVPGHKERMPATAG